MANHSPRAVTIHGRHASLPRNCRLVLGGSYPNRRRVVRDIPRGFGANEHDSATWAEGNLHEPRRNLRRNSQQQRDSRDNSSLRRLH